MNFKKLFEGIAYITATATVFTALSVTPSVVTNPFVEANIAFAADDDEPRKPPQARSSQTLSKRVSDRVFEVMELRDAEDFTGALSVLDEVKEMYDDDRLNEREAYTMWLFYASIAQQREMYPEAIAYFTEILALKDDVTAEQYEQTLSSIGALNFVLERYEDAIDIYLEYNEIAMEPNADVYLRLATAHYQLEQYQQGIPYLLTNMEITRAAGEEVEESTYSLLRALYITIEDYPNARQILREMVVLFNKPEDWTYLAGIAGQMELFEEQSYTYYVANAMGYIDDSETQLLSFAGQLFNNENPYGAAMLIEDGISRGVIEENESNLSFLSTAYQVAREDQKAVEPLLKAAEMADDGEFYNRLGVIYTTMGEFESAVDAFNQAINKGNLDRIDQVYIRQAVAFFQLNRFDEGLVAAREAAKDERSESSSASWVKALEAERRRYDAQEANRELYQGYFL